MTHGVELFSLAGKTALVTGATGHLGREMSRALAEAGAHVLINGRSEERVGAWVAELRAQGLSAEGAVFDITDRHKVESFFHSWTGTALHVLVNNAYLGGAGSFVLSDEDSYRDSYDVVVLAAHRVVRAGLAHLRRAGASGPGASIINIASMYGMVSPDPRVYDSGADANPPFYGAAKAALLQWTRFVACELGPEGIRVNSISPGPFPSVSVQASNPAFVRRLTVKVPLGRIGLPEELKGPILFLASNASSFVTGSNLVVDGGWTSW